MKLYCATCGYMPSYDEWASKTTCIDCGPLEENTDSSKEIKESVTKGEKDIPISLL
jgi:Zn ribbon nucleic-acid-binding protein